MKRNSGTGWAILIAMALGISDLHAGTFVVSNNADSGPGSLRQAILDSNAGGGGAIDLTGVSGTITVATNLPVITASANLLGPGTNVLTVNGSNAWVLFTFQTGTRSTIANLAIANGFAMFNIPPSPTGNLASGIRNFGTLKMQTCLLSHCRNSGTDGGAIYNSGGLELDNCRITDCGSEGTYGDVPGGAVYNVGLLSMYNCISDSCTGVRGGGIYNEGGSLLTQCLFTGCGTDDQGDGAAIYNYQGQLTLLACVLTNNGASWRGGGIASWGGLIMAHTTLANNDGLEGGGLYLGNSSASAFCLNCTFSGNFSYEYGGGGIKNLQALTMLNCTVSGNTCYANNTGDGGGGIENLKLMMMTNCTVSGNSNLPVASNSPTPHGGGIMNGTNATAYLTDCTVVSNSASVAMGVENIAGTVYLRDSIVANNGTDFSGTLNSQGYNLIRNTNGCTLLGDSTGNQYGRDPLIGPLQNNGGPTLTHALMAGSPAIDAGPTNSAPYFDQRGALRPFGVAEDIGAFEYGSVPFRRIASLAPVGTGGMKMSLTGSPGFTYIVEKAPTPSGPWTSLTVITADSDGGGICLDPNPVADRAFYRMVFP